MNAGELVACFKALLLRIRANAMIAARMRCIGSMPVCDFAE